MGHSSALEWLMASPDDAPLGAGAACWSAAGSTAASPPPCHHIGSSADASPYDSAEEGPTRGEPARWPVALNAGEAVDMALHDWATGVPALVGGGRAALEAPGRSAPLWSVECLSARLE